MSDKEFNGLSLDELEDVAGGVAANRQSGMPCPQCHGFIPTNMEQIARKHIIECPHCGLRLNINRPENGLALETLEKFGWMQKNGLLDKSGVSGNE